jgi:hypothetical protein
MRLKGKKKEHIREVGRNENEEMGRKVMKKKGENKGTANY